MTISNLRRRYITAVFERLKRVTRRLLRAEALVYAGYLSFLTLLGLVPALAVTYWLAEQSAITKLADASLRSYLTTHVFPESASQLMGSISKLRVNARKLGVVALIAVFIDVLFKAYALHGAVRRIASEHVARWWSPIVLMVIALVAVPLCVAACVWSLQFCESFLANLMPTYRKQIDWLFMPLQVSLPLWAAIYVFYRGGVPARASKRDIAFAAAMAMLAIEAVRLFMTGYFANLAQVRSLYGAFSAVPVMMLSIFVSWCIVLAGVAWLVENAPRR